jgi:hypothetical protein
MAIAMERTTVMGGGFGICISLITAGLTRSSLLILFLGSREALVCPYSPFNLQRNWRCR